MVLKTSTSSGLAQMAQYSMIPTQAQASRQTIPNQYSPMARRTMSNATDSTSPTGGGGILPVRTNSGVSSNTTSSRSSTSPTSYVALVRRQKGTVWCERAQYEEPLLAAQRRAAKQRAAMEMVGGNQGGRASASGSPSITGGVRLKMRHHRAQKKASTYSPATLSGTGLPMRLSANEVDEGNSDDGDGSLARRQHHHETDSGRSSLNSASRVQYLDGQGAPYCHDSTPTNGHHASSPNMSQGAGLEDETPVPSVFSGKGRDYFDQRGGGGRSRAIPSSEERESSFGRVGQMPPRWPRKQEDERKDSDDLQRRGSVDDRTMTMGGGRLFVANPDRSD